MTVVNQKHFLEPATETAIKRIKRILQSRPAYFQDREWVHEIIIKELCANTVELNYDQILLAESYLIDFALAQEEVRNV